MKIKFFVILVIALVLMATVGCGSETVEISQERYNNLIEWAELGAEVEGLESLNEYLNDEIDNLESENSRLESVQYELETEVLELKELNTGLSETNIVLENEKVGLQQEINQKVAELNPCIPKTEVVTFRYVLMNDLPVPENEKVEFVKVCGEFKPAIRWVETIGTGEVTHYYYFDGVEVNFSGFEEPGVNSYTDLRDPVVGDRGIVNYYADWDGNTEEKYGDDGVVDNMGVLQIREWTEIEQALIDFGNQFYDDAVSEGFFYFWYATDCGASEYLMNGQPVKPGPYGSTIEVPAEGGLFEAYYKAGKCNNDEPFTRWSFDVMPGDALIGTERLNQSSMKNADPWHFCNRIDDMAPQWQAEKYVSPKIQDACSALKNVTYDIDAISVLNREGFDRADTLYGDNVSEDWVPFVWRGGGRGVNHTWPKYDWMPVDTIKLSITDTYTVALDYESLMPIISLEGGDQDKNSYSSDIPWYQKYGDPIVFVNREQLSDYYFNWYLAKMYRIRLVNGKTIVEQAIWQE